MKPGVYQIRRITVMTAVFCCLHVCMTGRLSAENSDGAGSERYAPPVTRYAETEVESAPDFPVYLYFADSSAPFLRGEERSGLKSEDPAVFCRQIVEALIAGPSKGLVRTIPPETKLRSVFIDEQTAYVDLSRDIMVSHPGGIVTELMTIYSIVNSLVLNVEAVDTVKLLIAGQDADTVSGHIDIRFPLHADIILIR